MVDKHKHDNRQKSSTNMSLFLALFSSCLVAFDLLNLQLICYNLKMDTKFRESFGDQTIISDEILNGCLVKPMGLYRV